MSVKFQKRFLWSMLCIAPVGLNGMNAALAEMMAKRAAKTPTPSTSPIVSPTSGSVTAATQEDRVAKFVAAKGAEIVAAAKSQGLEVVTAFPIQKAFKAMYPAEGNQNAPATQQELQQIMQQLNAQLNPAAKSATPTLPQPGKTVAPVKVTTASESSEKKYVSFKELSVQTQAIIEQRLEAFVQKVSVDKVTVDKMVFTTHALIVPMQKEVLKILDEMQKVAVKLKQEKQCLTVLTQEAATSKIPNFSGNLAVLPRKEGNESIAVPLKELVRIFNDNTREFNNILALISKGDSAPASPAKQLAKTVVVPGAKTGGSVLVAPAKTVETTETVFNAWFAPRKKKVAELPTLIRQLDTAVQMKSVAKIIDLNTEMQSIQSLMQKNINEVSQALQEKQLDPLNQQQQREVDALKLSEVQKTLQEKIDQCKDIILRVNAAFTPGATVIPSSASSAQASVVKAPAVSEAERKAEIARLQKSLDQAKMVADGKVGQVTVHKDSFRDEGDRLRADLLKVYDLELSEIKSAVLAGHITSQQSMDLSKQLQDSLIELLDSYVQSFA